jgi:phosphatidylglycerophosphate synthase
MLDSYGRSFYQTYCLDPFLKWPFWRHLHPHTITAMGALIGIGICPLLALGWSKWALLALVLSGFLDTLDGSLARLYCRASSQGAAFDICCDRLVEFSIVLGLYLVDPPTRAFATLCMLGSVLLCVTTFLVVGIFAQQTTYHKSFYYSPGLMERTEAFILFFAMIAWPAQFWWLAFLFSGLVMLTAVIRLWQFMKA